MLRVNSKDGLFIVTLSSPETGNKLNPESLSALDSALKVARADDEVRVIIIRSSGAPGDAWCLGMDLDRLEESLTTGESTGDVSRQREAAVALYSDILAHITESPKPVIACVGGQVAAGGVGLAAACDIVLASSSASFQLSEVYFGLIPANVLPFVFNRRMSPARARYLVLSAKKIGAQEARESGLADESFEDGEAEGVVRGLIKHFFRAEPDAVAETKVFTNSLSRLDFESQREAAKASLLALMEKPKVKEGLQALSSGNSLPWFKKIKVSDPVFFETTTSGERA